MIAFAMRVVMPGETGIITPAQRLLQRTHQSFPGIGVEGFKNAERLRAGLRRWRVFPRSKPAGGGLSDKGLGGMSQILPAIAASLAGAEHADGISGRGLGCF